MASRPHLAAAFLCEKVLSEKDEVLSAIRIVDRFYVTVPKTLPSDLNPSVLLTVFLAFKKSTPGNDPEPHEVTLIVRPPSGPRTDAAKPKFEFVFPQGQPAGANLIGQISLGIKEFGLFWIDVLLDDESEPITRIPFQLIEQQQPPIPEMKH